VQIAGRFGDDALLLRIAGQIESAQPWDQLLPTAGAL
jgi:Asp-tRNA(Asn)/Glu-tRNA(Gln) amidotransferase A subunit family amidase